jgi:hypothetical protein
VDAPRRYQPLRAGLLAFAVIALTAVAAGVAVLAVVDWHSSRETQTSSSITPPPSAEVTTDEIGEPFDLETTNPVALKAIQAIVPSALWGQDWVYNLNGTAPPLRAVTVAGQAYLAGQVCKSHFCAGHTFLFLVAANGSRAVGLLKSEELLGGKPTEFGALSMGDKAFLEKSLAEIEARP